MSDINRPLSGFRLVDVQYGDTLQRIAARELGDASRWRDLITLNNLTYPYLTGDPALVSATVKAYGALIAVPAATATVSADIDPDEVFGIDIEINGGFLTEGANGELLTVSGRDNYKQALENRIATDQRELLFHLPYGCGVRALLGTVQGPTAALLAAQYVKSSVEADPRTDQVTSSIAKVVGDGLAVITEAVPITGSPVRLSKTF